MPFKNIYSAYKILGIQNYTQFIYLVNKEIKIFYLILNYERKVDFHLWLHKTL